MNNKTSCVASLIPLFSDVKPTVFLHSLFRENRALNQIKKYQGNADKFIPINLQNLG